MLTSITIAKSPLAFTCQNHLDIVGKKQKRCGRVPASATWRFDANDVPITFLRHFLIQLPLPPSRCLFSCPKINTTQHLPTITHPVADYKRNAAPFIFKFNNAITSNFTTRTASPEYQPTNTMSANTVYVKNISSQTGEKEVNDFFSFW